MKTQTVTRQEIGNSAFNQIVIEAISLKSKAMVQCPYTWNKTGHRAVRWITSGLYNKPIVRWLNSSFELNKAKIRDYGSFQQIIFILEI